LSQFRCQIVTPSESILDEEVEYVSFPAWDGEIGVMNGTSPFLMNLGTGPMRIDFGSGSRHYLLEGGFAQMQDDTLTLLADDVMPADHIELKDAELELEEANRLRAQAGRRCTAQSECQGRTRKPDRVTSRIRVSAGRLTPSVLKYSRQFLLPIARTSR
jgi:F-type H+-transporting ATPase subunit epsilon